MEKLDLSKQSLRKFGITMAVAFGIITMLILWRHKHSILPTSVISVLFLILGLIAPKLLKPIYIIWMKFAFILGWINTRIILTILFYLIFSPIGLVMRLFGADLLDRKMDKRNTYWHKREKKDFNPLDYERQF